MKDITKEVEYKKSLQAKQIILDRVAKLTKIGGWEYDVENETVLWTNEVYNIHERENPEITVEEAIDYYIPEDRPIISDAMAKAIEKQILFHLTLKIKTDKGNIKDVLTSSQIVTNDEGVVTHIIGAFEDVTEKKKRRDYQKMLEAVVVNASEPVMITDANPDNPKIIYVNKRITTLTGYTKEELIGKNPNIFQGLRTTQASKMQFKKSLLKFEPFNIDIVNYKKDGTEFINNINLVVNFNAQGEPVHFIAFQRDVTEERRHTRSLEHSVRIRTRELSKINEKLKHFARVISHDLRTPLRVVSNYLGLLQLSISDKMTEKEIRYLKNAKQGAIEAMLLLDSILEYSSSKSTNLKFEPTDTHKIVVKLCTEDFQTRIQENNATITYNKLPNIIAAKYQIYQVFQNLLGNALKFYKTGSPPNIFIEHQEDKDFHYFSIKDNGIGIAAKELKAIFQPFTRSHRAESYEGHGIGLSICKEIIEAHHGELTVTSVLNEGSNFEFSISKNLHS